MRRRKTRRKGSGKGTAPLDRKEARMERGMNDSAENRKECSENGEGEGSRSLDLHD